MVHYHSAGAVRFNRPLRALIILLTAGLLLSGCAPALRPVGVTPTTTVETPAPIATVTAASATAVAPPTAVATRPTGRAERATAAPRANGRDEPVALFGPAWGDLSIYGKGLISSERASLRQHAGASEYRILLVINDNMTTVTGRQQVRYTNREDEPLAEVYLRLFPNALGASMVVSNVTVNGAAAAGELQYENTAVRVPMPAPLAPEESAVVELEYVITVPDTLDTGYGLISYTDGILALDAPYAPIPVYDETGWNVETPPVTSDTSFNDVSYYLVQVTAPADLILVATGVEVSRETDGGGQFVTFAQGPARDFFLAASTNYVASSRQVGETRINSYSLGGQDEAREAALEVAGEALHIYSERFGPYPYAELDVAATPMLALGIEYPGTVGISLRVYEPPAGADAEAVAAMRESTIAHELAHQWFYNLVGSDQIDEPWLDEAVVQYSTSLYFLDRYGPEAAAAWQESWGSRWERVERDLKPVGLPAREYTPREYSSIVYGRGPLFLATLAERMGQETFDRFLSEYAARFRWQIAAAEDFKAMAEQACGCELDDLYDEWLEP